MKIDFLELYNRSYIHECLTYTNAYLSHILVVTTGSLPLLTVNRGTFLKILAKKYTINKICVSTTCMSTAVTGY